MTPAECTDGRGFIWYKSLPSDARDAEPDPLFVGHSGHSGLWGTFLGTTADKVVRHAPRSVFIVR
jgi:nucleotide-binding universal stress UspA family protein